MKAIDYLLWRVVVTPSEASTGVIKTLRCLQFNLGRLCRRGWQSSSPAALKTITLRSGRFIVNGFTVRPSITYLAGLTYSRLAGSPTSPCSSTSTDIFCARCVYRSLSLPGMALPKCRGTRASSDQDRTLISSREQCRSSCSRVAQKPSPLHPMRLYKRLLLPLHLLRALVSGERLRQAASPRRREHLRKRKSRSGNKEGIAGDLWRRSCRDIDWI